MIPCPIGLGSREGPKKGIATLAILLALLGEGTLLRHLAARANIVAEFRVGRTAASGRPKRATAAQRRLARLAAPVIRFAAVLELGTMPVRDPPAAGGAKRLRVSGMSIRRHPLRFMAHHGDRLLETALRCRLVPWRTEHRID